MPRITVGLPIIEVNGLARCEPLHAAGWNAARLLSDVFTDRQVTIVALEHRAKTEFLPHLSEARIDVEKYAPSYMRKNFFVAQESHDIDQERGLAGFFQQFRPGNPDDAIAVSVEQRI